MADYINKIRTKDGDKPVNYEALANKPNSLPNPNKIKFTGSVVAEYDGSSEVTVNIPNGASEEQAAQIQTNTNDISELKNKTSELKSDLTTIRQKSKLYLQYGDFYEFELGSINPNNGELYDNSKTVRSKDFLKFDKSDYLTINKPNTCDFTLFVYDSNEQFISSTWVATNITEQTFKVSADRKYKFIYLFNPSVTITSSLAETMKKELKLSLLSQILETKITISPSEYGAKGDGVTDDTNALKSFFADLYSKNLIAKFDSSEKYLVTGNIGSIKKSIDFNGCSIVVGMAYDYSNPIFDITPENIINIGHGWYRSSDSKFTDGLYNSPKDFVCLATSESYPMGKRNGTGDSTNWKRVMHIRTNLLGNKTVDGECSNYADCYYTISNAHIIEKNIKISNLKLAYGSDDTIKTIGLVFKVSRSNVTFENITIDGDLISSAEGVTDGGTVFNVHNCSKIKFSNVVGYNPIHCYSSGYIVDFTADDVQFYNCKLMSHSEDSWGAIGGGFISNITCVNSTFSRFDSHYGHTGKSIFVNCKIDLFTYSTGDANIEFDNCLIGRVIRRIDYTPPFIGKIIIKNSSLECAMQLTSRLSTQEEVALFEENSEWLNYKNKGGTFELFNTRLYYIKSGMRNILSDVVSEQDGFFNPKNTLKVIGCTFKITDGVNLVNIKSGLINVFVDDSVIYADFPFRFCKNAIISNSYIYASSAETISASAENELYTNCIIDVPILQSTGILKTTGCIINGI